MIEKIITLHFAAPATTAVSAETAVVAVKTAVAITIAAVAAITAVANAIGTHIMQLNTV